MTNIVEQVRVYGPPTAIQAPQIPMISAEQAGDLVVRGIMADELLILTDPMARSMMEHHVHDAEGFLRQEIAYLEGT